MDRWGRILLAAATALGAAACTAEQLGQVLTLIRPAQVLAHGRVTGKIVDQETQRPIGDARLQIGTQKTSSDESGVYGVSDLLAGTLFLRVEAAGYQPFFGEVQIAAAGTTTFDVPLKPLTGASPSPAPTATPTPLPSEMATPTPIPPLASPDTPSPLPASDTVASAVPTPLASVLSDVVATPEPTPSASAGLVP